MAYKCRLNVILTEMDIKHAKFAEQIGIGKSSFSKIVNNKSLPSFETLYTIVEELTKRNPQLKLGDIWRKE